MIIHIPSYNEATIMEPFIQALKNQKATSFSLILHDDCSKDDTVANFEHFAEEAGLKHSASINPVNIGLVRNLRKIYQWAPAISPEFMLASDHERYSEDHVEALHSAARESKSCALVYADSYLECEKTGKAVENFRVADIGTTGLDRVESFEKVIRNYDYANPLWGLYRSQFCCMASPFPFGRGGDHAFIAGIALTGEIRFINQKTWTRRRNQQRTIVDLARLESPTQFESEIVERAKWNWLSFWQAHYEVITNSAISNAEKIKCIEISIKVCNQKSRGNLILQMDQILSSRNGPVDLIFTALTLNSIIKT